MSFLSKRVVPLGMLLALPALPLDVSPLQAQAPAAGASQSATPRQSGTVKAVTPQDFVLTTPTGDVAVTVPGSAKILLVPPRSKDLPSAQPGTLADVAAGDRAIVSGTAGDTGPMMNATRVIVMKSTAIAARGAADQAAWTRGVGGIVRTVDPGTGIITVANSTRVITVDSNAKTTVRRYAGSSVRFEDAVLSTVGAIQPGDQLRARGERSPDGTTLVADEIVSGSFGNFSGLLTAVDLTAGTVTLKDLATKRPVTILVTDKSDLRRLPPGTGAGARAGGEGAGRPTATSSAPPAGERPAGSGGAGSGTGGGSGRSGMDLSRMLPHMPAATLSALKPGDAVMIVASNNPQSSQPSAITLLVGVEQILAAHPAGETTLSPWSLGGGGEGEAGAQ